MSEPKPLTLSDLMAPLYSVDSEAHDRLQAAFDTIQSLNAAYAVAIAAFLAKWTEVEPSINGLFALNQIRSGRSYQGPTLTAELEQLRSVIAPTPDILRCAEFEGFVRRRLQELAEEFGFTDSHGDPDIDTLKHRLEDHERWRQDLLSGRLVETDGN